MAQHMNSFDLLGDDEGDDVSALLARVVAYKVEAPPASDNGKQKQQMKYDRATRTLPLSDTVRSENESEKGDCGGDLSRLASVGTDVELFLNGGSNGDEENHGGTEDSQWQLVGSKRHQQNNGGDSYWNNNDNGRGRGRGRSRGRGHSRGRGFNGRVSADRGYNGGNRGYRVQEEDSYRRYGRNYNGSRELNNSEMREESHGNMSFAVNGDSNDGNRGGNVPVPTEIAMDPEPREGQWGDVDNQENSEKAAEEETFEKKTKSGKEVEWLSEEIEEKEKEDHERRRIEVEEEKKVEMTLEQYEKLLLEKRNALESLKSKERTVTPDKEFESMQLVEKKREDGYSRKLKSEKDKLKRKDSVDKEEKARKVVSINEFLKPAAGEEYARRGRGGQGRGQWRGRGHGESGYRGGPRRGRGENGGYRGGRPEQLRVDDHGSMGGYASLVGNSELHIQDHVQFPGLREA